jgi:hypothetical protein
VSRTYAPVVRAESTNSLVLAGGERGGLPGVSLRT